MNRWTLFRDHAVVVLLPGDALAAMDHVPASALAKRPVIGRLAAPLPSGGEASAAFVPGAVLPLPRHRAATDGHAMHLVRAGLGVAISTGRAAHDPALLCRPLEPATEHVVVLAAVAGRPHTRATRPKAQRAGTG